MTQEIAFTSLRFFNIIGCGSFPLAYDSSEECLVPVIAKGMLSNTMFRIFGHTHPTADGTCVRDYLDVRDLASVHNIVADRMGSQLLPKVINVSSGNPITVLQVLTEFESVTGQKVRHEKVPADPADPISVWSHKSKVLTELGWVPRFTLRDSIASHWQSFNAPLI
jgi:UDP-glucose 4-epimerase